MAKDVRTVSAPDGRCFAIFLGAPGSLLDAGSDQLHFVGWAGMIELLVHAVHAFGRASGRDWRLDVEPLSVGGHLGDALYRERFADEEAAEKRSAELAGFIKSGAWDPACRRTPPDAPA
jgi:hypothetical protein